MSLSIKSQNHGDGIHPIIDHDDLIASVSGATRQIIASMQCSGLLHNDDVDDLLDRSRRYLRAFLRSLSPEDFSEHSRAVLRRRLLVKIVQLFYPASIQINRDNTPIQPQSRAFAAFNSLVLIQPKYQVGGDLARVDEAADGSIWVLLADVTGKSVTAYLTAMTLDAAWDRLQDDFCVDNPKMALTWLESELAGCLPDGIFVETVIANAKVCGNVDLAAAGFVQFLTGLIPEVEDIKVGGAYLGIRSPESFSERSQTLKPNHELVLATDGVFEQPDGARLLRDTIRDRVNSSGNHSVHQAVLEVVETMLLQHPQRDDLTIVTLRRRIDPESETDA